MEFLLMVLEEQLACKQEHDQRALKSSVKTRWQKGKKRLKKHGYKSPNAKS